MYHRHKKFPFGAYEVLPVEPTEEEKQEAIRKLLQWADETLRQYARFIVKTPDDNESPFGDDFPAAKTDYSTIGLKFEVEAEILSLYPPGEAFPHNASEFYGRNGQQFVYAWGNGPTRVFVAENGTGGYYTRKCPGFDEWGVTAFKSPEDALEFAQKTIDQKFPGQAIKRD